jgi:hypothetical protein
LPKTVDLSVQGLGFDKSPLKLTRTSDETDHDSNH